MASSESPASARRRLRFALRRERDAKGLTQQEVADALDWSLSKVNRIENGEVTISGTDLQALLRLLGVTDAATVSRLVEHARAARRRGWWDEPRYKEHLTPATLQLLQFESQASEIRAFHSTLVPGLFQTPEYAQAILDFWQEELPEDKRKIRLDVRMQRQSQVFDRPDPPRYLLVLDESVALREVGGPSVMLHQLDRLVAIGRAPNVEIRILPFQHAAIMGAILPFILLDLGDEENAVVYREGHLADEIAHAVEVLRRHRKIFQDMWDRALAADTTTRLFEARIAELRAAIARGQAAG